jgi:hypothetical protein
VASQIDRSSNCVVSVLAERHRHGSPRWPVCRPYRIAATCRVEFAESGVGIATHRRASPVINGAGFVGLDASAVSHKSETDRCLQSQRG